MKGVGLIGETYYLWLKVGGGLMCERGGGGYGRDSTLHINTRELLHVKWAHLSLPFQWRLECTRDWFLREAVDYHSWTSPWKRVVVRSPG